MTQGLSANSRLFKTYLPSESAQLLSPDFIESGLVSSSFALVWSAKAGSVRRLQSCITISILISAIVSLEGLPSSISSYHVKILMRYLRGAHKLSYENGVENLMLLTSNPVVEHCLKSTLDIANRCDGTLKSYSSYWTSVLCHQGIGSQQGNALDRRLCNKNSVKGIFVNRWQSINSDCMLTNDR
jgi:hypothetical protein